MPKKGGTKVEFNLKKLRAESGMTQVELSEKSGVGRITISRLESGELKETTLGTLTKLAKALQVSVDDLIKS